MTLRADPGPRAVGPAGGPPSSRTVSRGTIGKPLSPSARRRSVARGGGTCRTSPHRVHRHVGPRGEPDVRVVDRGARTTTRRRAARGRASGHAALRPGRDSRSRSQHERDARRRAERSAEPEPRRWRAAAPEPRRARRPATHRTERPTASSSHRRPPPAIAPPPARRGKQEGAVPVAPRLPRCAPEGTRTPNLLIRSQMLYPLSYGRMAPQGRRRRYRPGARSPKP